MCVCIVARRNVLVPSPHAQGVAESESRRACDLAEATYKQSFDAAIIPDENALLAEHQVGPMPPA